MRPYDMGALTTAVAANVRADEAIRKIRLGIPVHEPRQFYVYFLSAKCEGYPVKIGLTLNRESRFSALQTSIPYDIDVIGLWAVKDKSAERDLHKRFSHIRLRGEWFERTPELMKFIDGLSLSQHGDDQ